MAFHFKRRQKKEMLRITEYMISGGAWFWSGYFIIVFLTPVIGLWWANLLGNGVGVTINFILSRYWVFSGSKDKQVTKVTTKYVVLTGFNFILNYFILRGLQLIGIDVAIGQFIASAFFTVWNYLWYKLWVFTTGTKPAPKRQAAPVLRRSKYVRPQVKKRKR